jgi:hypothetical protein
MRKIVLPLAWVLTAFPLADAAAQVGPANQSPTPQMRTYVSGGGRDSNPCTASSPCQTFQAALAMTVAGGEIFVLDSADYGVVTINKAVSITNEGAVASVLATSGVSIMIAAGAGDVVNLRGLDIDGGNSGAVGINFYSGRLLNIQRSVIRNFKNTGLCFCPNGPGALFLTDTTVTNNSNNGILVMSAGSAVSGSINRVTASANYVGVLAYNPNASVTIIDTVAGNNSYGIGASSSAVMVRNSTVSNNAVGIAATQGGIIRVGQSAVTANGTGWQATNGGEVQSYGNNGVMGNTTDGALTSTIALQ